MSNTDDIKLLLDIQDKNIEIEENGVKYVAPSKGVIKPPKVDTDKGKTDTKPIKPKG